MPELFKCWPDTNISVPLRDILMWTIINYVVRLNWSSDLPYRQLKFTRPPLSWANHLPTSLKLQASPFAHLHPHYRPLQGQWAASIPVAARQTEGQCKTVICGNQVELCVPSNPSFESLVIKENDVYCIVPKNHRLNEKSLIHARDLAEENFISYMPKSKFRFEVDQFFEAKKIKRCMQYETRTTDAICSLVGRGLGVSVIGSSEAYLNTIPECIALPFAAPISFRAFLFWSKNKPLSAIAETFLNIAKASINTDWTHFESSYEPLRYECNWNHVGKIYLEQFLTPTSAVQMLPATQANRSATQHRKMACTNRKSLASYQEYHLLGECWNKFFINQHRCQKAKGEQ